MDSLTETIQEVIRIHQLSVSAYEIPTATPEADGTLEWNSTTLVLVEIDAQDKKGIGYTYASAVTADFIHRELKDIVMDGNAMNIPELRNALVRQVRNNGNSGIAAMAISAIDCALWDLKAKIMEVPLCALLGMVRDEMLIYGSGGFTSYSTDQLQKQLGNWVNEGIKQVKMKIGSHPEKDVERVRLAREAIGKETELFVDANGAYNVKQAIDLAEKFSKYDVTWFEEPVTSDNLTGLSFIRKHVSGDIKIAAGEYGYNLPYFEAMLEAGAVDVLQADASRCGGITNFLKAGDLCEARHLPFSSHCATSLHLHAALSLPSFYIAEYFYDHARIEQMLFDGSAQPINGVLKPDLSRNGLGIEFKYKDAERYRI